VKLERPSPMVKRVPEVVSRGIQALLVTLLIATGACARPPAVPVFVPDKPIVVLSPNDRSGAAVASLFEGFAPRAERMKIADVFADEAAAELVQRGRRVIGRDTIPGGLRQVPTSPESAAEIARGEKLDALALYVEIRRWEADAKGDVPSVIVELSAALVDPQTGRVVWRGDRPAAPIAMPREATLESAYRTAARKAIAEVLGPLGR